MNQSKMSDLGTCIQSQYIFGVITYGGFYGTAFNHLAKYIEGRGGLLGAYFPIQMPGNNINLYNAWPNVIQRILIKNQSGQIPVNIAQLVFNGAQQKQLNLGTKHLREGSTGIRR